MKTKYVSAAIVFLMLTVYGCEGDTLNSGGSGGNNNGNPEWLIPVGEVRDGGPGKDGIPALEDPEFVSGNEIGYLNDDDLVLAYKEGDVVKLYPHPILDWHEIINDNINGVHVAITYCPLTGTGIGWDRNIGGSVTTFGVSGLLYNSNLIPYDRATNSNWSQMRLDCVNGDLIENKVVTLTLFETTWKTAKSMFNNASVVSANTGFSRSYGRYPYGSYKTDNSYLIFPVSNKDDRLPNKERVLGVVEVSKTKIYRFKTFGQSLSLIKDVVNDKPLVVVGNQPDNFIIAFYSTIDGTELTFEVEQNNHPIILSDNEGNKWDVFGFAVEGPRKGKRLKSTKSFMGYWFAWATFYPDLEIFE